MYIYYDFFIIHCLLVGNNDGEIPKEIKQSQGYINNYNISIFKF